MQQWDGGTVGGRSSASGGPYGLNDVQGWELGADGWGLGEGVGVWDQFLKTALHTISISLQNSFCESHTWRLVT